MSNNGIALGYRRRAGRLNHQRSDPVATTPKPTSTPMSNSHRPVECFHEASEVASTLTACTSTVEADADKPHRDGTIQAICSRPNRPSIGYIAPANTTEISTISTAVKTTCSE